VRPQLYSTGMALKLNPFTRAAAAAEARQFRFGREPVHVRIIPELSIAPRAVVVTCDSSRKRREGRRSPHRSRSLNQATSASVSASWPQMAPAQTGLELINDLLRGQGISDALLDSQKRDSHYQELKISIDLCKKEYFVVPKAMAGSDLKFYDEEDERFGKKVWFQLVRVEVDPGECFAISTSFLANCCRNSPALLIRQDAYMMSSIMFNWC
jgi:hypothetical protein